MQSQNVQIRLLQTDTTLWCSLNWKTQFTVEYLKRRRMVDLALSEATNVIIYLDQIFLTVEFETMFDQSIGLQFQLTHPGLGQSKVH
jgi:hypothetical protein